MIGSASSFDWPPPPPVLSENGAAFLLLWQAELAWAAKVTPPPGVAAEPAHPVDAENAFEISLFDPPQTDHEARRGLEFDAERMREGEKSAEEGRVRRL